MKAHIPRCSTEITMSPSSQQQQKHEIGSSVISTSPSTEVKSTLSYNILTAEEWFAKGRRVPFDPVKKRILPEATLRSVYVWERVVAPFEVCRSTRWLTMLPGPPDGTYAFSKVNDQLQTAPRLYVEFVGLGDSDKPNDYSHSVMERADLVEAHWRAHKVRRTVLVCQSCSSMVMMELLNRQQERLSLGLPPRTRIEHILCFNGAYFAHTHTPHPLNSSALMKYTVGRVASKAAQRSNLVLEPILKKSYSKEYQVSKMELR
jgi:pimeloyl-ACP methyl ester carboxylesterase